MSITESPPLTIVQPGGGRTGGLAPGIGVVFKLSGEDTGGALSVVEHPFEIGALVPPHLHTREDEYSIVLEGEIGFRSGDREVVLGPGGYITKPRNEMHAMWNAGVRARPHDRDHQPRRVRAILRRAGQRRGGRLEHSRWEVMV